MPFTSPSPRALLRVCTLGPLLVEIDGVGVDLERRTEQLLLAALAAAGGEFVDGADLTDIVWGGRPLSSSTISVATVVWRLQQTLGAATVAIVTREHPLAYALDREVTTFDVDQFDDARRQGRERLLTGDLDGAIRLLDAALDLWRGAPFEGLGEHRLFKTAVVRLGELQRSAIEDRATALIRAQRPADAVAQLQSLVRAEPLREPAWGLLVRALFDAGAPDEAGRALDEARRNLVAVGLEPGLALRRAAGELHAAQRPVWPRRRSSGDVPHLPGPFVGREREMDELVRIATATSHRSCLVIIKGEPGTGKTRLAAEVAKRVSTDRAIHFLSLEGDSVDPYRPLVELVRVLTAGVDVRLSGAVERLLDPEDQRLQLDDLEGEGARAALLEGVEAIITETCVNGALIVVDDAQSGSPVMLELLRRLGESAVPSPVTVLAVIRTPFDGLQQLEAVEQLATAVIHLAGLAPDELSSLTRSLLSGHVPDDGAQRWIAEQTAGNPLFASVLLGDRRVRRALIAGEAPPPRDGPGHAVAGYLASFTGSWRQVLQGAALLGRATFDNALITEIASNRGVDVDMTAAAIEDAVAVGVLVSEPGPVDMLRFAHGLVRDVLAGEIDGTERAQWHRACAVTLERRAVYEPALTGDVASHHARAWPYTPAAEAAQWLVVAAASMSRLVDHEAATRLLATAADLLAREPDAPAPLVVKVHLLRARACIDLGDRQGAFAATRAGAEVARRANWPDGLAMAAIRAADIPEPTTEERVEIETLLVEAVRLGAEVSAGLRGKVLSALALAQPEMADRMAADDVAACRHRGSPAEVATLLAELWIAASGPAQLEIAAEVATLGESVGSASLEAHGLLKGWITAVALGRTSFDDPIGPRLTRLVDEAADPLLDWSFTAWLAVRSIATGAFAVADDLLARSLRLPLELGRDPLSPPVGRLLSLHAAECNLMAFLRNDPQGMATAVAAAAGSWSARGIDHRWLVSARHPTDPHIDKRVIDELTTSLRAMSRPTLHRVIGAAVLSGAAAPLGHRAGIEAAREVLAAHSGQHVVYESMYLGTVDQHLGWIHLFAGEWDTAVTRLEAALVQLDAAGSLPFVVRVARNLAAALRGRGATGDTARADELEARASGLAVQLGVLPGAYRPTLPHDR